MMKSLILSPVSNAWPVAYMYLRSDISSDIVHIRAKVAEAPMGSTPSFHRTSHAAEALLSKQGGSAAQKLREAAYVTKLKGFFSGGNVLRRRNCCELRWLLAQSTTASQRPRLEGVTLVGISSR